MFGRVPPHTELRVFGSLSYINYTKAEAAIHGVKMEPAIYIGFNSVNSAHAFYCPRTKVRRHSVMVDIDEAFSSLQFFASQVWDGKPVSPLSEAGDVPLTSTIVTSTACNPGGHVVGVGLPRLSASVEPPVVINATNASRAIPLSVATSAEHRGDYLAALTSEAQSFKDNLFIAPTLNLSPLLLIQSLRNSKFAPSVRPSTTPKVNS